MSDALGYALYNFFSASTRSTLSRTVCAYPEYWKTVYQLQAAGNLWSDTCQSLYTQGDDKLYFLRGHSAIVLRSYPVALVNPLYLHLRAYSPASWSQFQLEYVSLLHECMVQFVAYPFEVMRLLLVAQPLKYSNMLDVLSLKGFSIYSGFWVGLLGKLLDIFIWRRYTGASLQRYGMARLRRILKKTVQRYQILTGAGIFSAVREIYETSGIFGFYGGFAYNLVRMGLQPIVVSVYDKALQAFFSS